MIEICMLGNLFALTTGCKALCNQAIVICNHSCQLPQKVNWEACRKSRNLLPHAKKTPSSLWRLAKKVPCQNLSSIFSPKIEKHVCPLGGWKSPFMLKSKWYFQPTNERRVSPLCGWKSCLDFSMDLQCLSRKASLFAQAPKIQVRPSPNLRVACIGPIMASPTSLRHPALFIWNPVQLTTGKIT